MRNTHFFLLKNLHISKKCLNFADENKQQQIISIMFYIGFTKKYYTLWEVENKGRWTYYTYKQNLSFDLDKAKAKVPSAIVDLSLRGSSSFRVEAVPQDCFQFGKHRGERFAECSDIDYMVWYHNTCKEEKLQKHVRPILEEKGFKLFNNEMHTDEEIAWLKKAIAQFPIFQAKIDAKQPFRLVMKKNLTKKYDEDFECEVGVYENFFCNLIFKDIVEQVYSNIHYYTPNYYSMTSIKNRTIVVSDYKAEKIGDTKFKIEVLKFDFE